MAEDEKNEAPKFFNIASWVMAGIGAVAFAFTMGFLAYQSAQNPILAKEVTANTATKESKCRELTKDPDWAKKCLYGCVVINNYPGGLTEPGSHQAYYDKMGEDFWRCFQEIIPGINQNEPCNSPFNQSKVTEFYKGAKSNGHELNFVADKAAFDKVPDREKKYAVIASSLKPSCVGPNSDKYDDLVDARGNPIVPEQENTTYETWKRQKEEAQAKAAAKPTAQAAQPAIGPPSSSQLKAPVSAEAIPGASGARVGTGQEATEADYNELAYRCLEALKNELSGESSPNGKFNWDYAINYFNYIRTKLYRDHERQYRECQALLAKVRTANGGASSQSDASITIGDISNIQITSGLPAVTLTVSGNVNPPGAGTVSIDLYTRATKGLSCTGRTFGQDENTYILRNEAVASYKSNDDIARILFVYSPPRGGLTNWAKSKLGLNNPAYDYHEFDVSDNYSGGSKTNINYTPSYKNGNGSEYYYLRNLYNCGP